MFKLYLSHLFLAVFIILLISSCKTDDDKDGIANEDDNCPKDYALTKDGCPVKREIKGIHFYMETSASMGGYFNGDTEFKTIVSDITSKVDKEIKPIDIWFVADTTTKYPKSVESFSSDIATTKIANKKSSELHKIFADIAAKTDSDDISFLVSDCILSFPNEQVKANPQINKTDANTTLRNNIFSTFTGLKKRGQAVSIYAFKSKFNGQYYDYQNVKDSLKGVERPFYVWVIGEKHLLKSFDDSLSNISTFKPEKTLHFGVIEQPVTQYGILTQVERNGNWTEDGPAVSDIEISANDSLRFCLALNLDSLPAYAWNISYLQHNIKPVFEGCTGSLRVKPKSVVDSSKITGHEQPLLFKRATHLLVFSVAKMTSPTAKITVNLPVQYDTWYQDWSTTDDKDIKAQTDKTFAFEYLINGVKEAYDTHNKSYISFSVPLNK